MKNKETIEVICNCAKCNNLSNKKEEEKYVDWYDGVYEYRDYNGKWKTVGI
jgi:hypothetical protein